MWAIGVITYFLLCGYTPFDRDSNLEEMQAILKADYSFTPLEYWRNVSLSARRFIQQCLTIDPNARMTSHQALTHPWITGEEEGGDKADLLPIVKKNFNARRTLHAAIDTIRAINQLRAGGAAAMESTAQDAGRNAMHATKSIADDGADKMEGVIQRSQPATESVKEGVGQLGNSLDPRGNARGQTEQQIQLQERRIMETATSLWQNRR